MREWEVEPEEKVSGETGKWRFHIANEVEAALAEACFAIEMHRHAQQQEQGGKAEDEEEGGGLYGRQVPFLGPGTICKHKGGGISKEEKPTLLR